MLSDGDLLSEWGATDDGAGSRHASAAPSPERRPGANHWLTAHRETCAGPSHVDAMLT